MTIITIILSFGLKGWYIITYALGIYYLNMLIAFLTPKIDPAIYDDFEGTLITLVVGIGTSFTNKDCYFQMTDHLCPPTPTKSFGHLSDVCQNSNSGKSLNVRDEFNYRLSLISGTPRQRPL